MYVCTYVMSFLCKYHLYEFVFVFAKTAVYYFLPCLNQIQDALCKKLII